LKLYSFLFFCFFSVSLSAQQGLIKEINISAQLLSTDKLGNLYILSDNKLLKYSSSGELLASFSPEEGSIITDIDTRNPFKVCLFYGFENKINILDNSLSLIGENLFLKDIKVYGESLFSVSEQGGFWIWDNDNYKLIKLNSSFIFEYEKYIDIDQYPVQIINNIGYVFFRTDIGNLICYKLSNSTISKHAIPRESSLLLSNGIMFFDRENQMFNIYDPEKRGFTKTKYDFPKNVRPLDALISGTMIFCFDEDKVYLFEISKN